MLKNRLSMVVLFTLILLTTLGIFQSKVFASDGAAKNLLVPSSSGFPKESITIIAPAGPGGGWDQLARVMQHTLVSEGISPVSVEVVNRGGAGGTIGLTELVTRHRRDSYTWMVGGSTLVSATIMHDSRFNLGGTELLARLASEYNVVAVPIDSPFKSMGDLIKSFKAHPDTFVWGGGSAGSADHLMIGMIAQDKDIEPDTINYVAYQGGGEAAAAVMGGQIQAGVAGYAEWKDLAEAGKMRLLAISAPKRLPGVDIPTLIESDINVKLENWRFVIAGPNLSPDDKIVIMDMITKMRNSDGWKQVLKRYSWEDRFLVGEELETYITQETRSTARLLADLGMLGGGKKSATGPYLFPKIILSLLTILSIILLFQAVRNRKNSKVAVLEGADDDPEIKWTGFLLSSALVFGYVLGLQFAGFLISTPIYFVMQSRIMGSQKLLRDVMISIVFSGVVFLIFEQLLSINVP